MSINVVEKNAQRLNKVLREQGASFPREWRQRVRGLLAQTFEAMNARPLDGPLCLRLSDQIEAELASYPELLEHTAVLQAEAPASPKERPAQKTSPIRKKESRSDSSSTPKAPGEALQNTGMPESQPKPQSVAPAPVASDGQTVATQPEKHPVIAPTIDDSPGLFDFIHIQIRCFFKIRACLKPPYIGKFVQFAENFADVREDRIESFIRVLSKGTEGLGAKTDVEVGYDDDLLPNMPSRDLVLHQRLKKRR